MSASADTKLMTLQGVVLWYFRAQRIQSFFEGMTHVRAFRISRSWQRRISGLLVAVLCLWLIVAATHSHSDDQDRHKHRTVAHLCSVCGSLSSGGAAASDITFRPSIVPDAAPVVMAETPPPSFRLIVSHRSRAPPVA
jgi:hypothetical protein